VDEVPIEAILRASDDEIDADEDPPIETPTGPLAQLRVDESIDPLHIHDPDSHAGTHQTGLPPELPSEGFLEQSPDLSRFLSAGARPEASVPAAVLPVATPSAAPADEPRREPASYASADDDAPRSAWPVALLASYASVMTLGFLWLWWTGGRPERVGESGTPSSVAAEDDPGLREGDSARLGRPEPLPAERIVELGETLRVGDLEVTPLDVSAVPVELVRTRIDGQVERKEGGRDALRLRLRLRNLSAEDQFAPLDEGFVRDPDRRMPDTFIDLPGGGRIYGYKLPARSEWAIAGQEFPTLRPGESGESAVFSGVSALPDARGTLTWRVRLRTSAGESQAIGVKFEGMEVKKGG
jgi:hypothetical protein